VFSILSAAGASRLPAIERGLQAEKDRPAMTDPVNETRRSFVVTSLVAAFGLMAGVVAIKAAQGNVGMPERPIHTDTTGLDAGNIHVPVADGRIRAYCAMPSFSGSYPVVLVAHESTGLDEHIRDLCRRFAKLGYVAVAPDLFARQGDAATIRDRYERAIKIVSGVTDSQVMTDLDAAAACAGALPRADGSRLAITGFGWGGRIVWLYAAHNPVLKAAVSWYGADWATTPLRPQNPVDVVADLKCPVMALHGAADEVIPQAIVIKRQDACRAHRKQCALRFYPGVGHGFNIEGHRNYRADATADAWALMLAWFRQHGAAPGAPVAIV
jgi:carboxymethylenebutenolidase